MQTLMLSLIALGIAAASYRVGVLRERRRSTKATWGFLRQLEDATMQSSAYAAAVELPGVRVVMRAFLDHTREAA